MNILEYKSELINAADAVKKYNDDEELYLSVVDAYIDGSDNLTEKLKLMFSSEDWAGYKFNVHALKGLSYSIGADTLGDRAFAHENAAKSLDSEFIKKDFDALMDLYNKTLDEAKSLLDTSDNEIEYGAMSPFEFIGRLYDIKKRIIDYRTEEAEEIIDEIYGVSVNGVTYESDFDTILYLMEKYDVTGASEFIDVILGRVELV